MKDFTVDALLTLPETLLNALEGVYPMEMFGFLHLSADLTPDNATEQEPARDRPVARLHAKRSTQAPEFGPISAETNTEMANSPVFWMMP